jgi:WD40-like Beta Propeller Repeat
LPASLASGGTAEDDVNTALESELGEDVVSPRPNRLDVVMGILSAVLVGGLFIDLWARYHGRADETFFNPWHAVLYAGVLLHGVVLFPLALRGRSRGLSLRQALPRGYGLSLVGAGLFLIAGVIDLGWHAVFGFEDGTEALLSPSHLLLATSGIFMVAGPVRAAWTKGVPHRFPHWVPWVLALTMMLSILTSFTEYAHPAVDTLPASPSQGGAHHSTLLLVDAEGLTQTRVPLGIGEDVWLPAFFPDGTRLLVSATDDQESGAMYVIELENWSSQVLWEGDGIFQHAAVSPDGARVAFTADGPQGTDIFVIEIESGALVQLTDDPPIDWDPAWSPDGTFVTFTSDRDGDGDLYTVPATGGDPVRLTRLSGHVASPAWSPDGSRIAFDADTDGDIDIFVMNADGSGLTALTVNEDYDSIPAWSPDGESIAFVSDRDGDLELYRMGLDGSAAVNLTRNPGAHDSWGGIAWSPDGSLIVTNTSGYPEGFNEPFVREHLGAATILVQAALIAGFLLLILRHGPLPFGAITVILVVNAGLMSVLADNYWYIAPAFVAGLAGDLLARSIRHFDLTRRARVLAAVVPGIWYAAYLAAVAGTQGGLGWSIHMIVGAPVLAGIVGLLLSLLVFPSRGAPALVK